MIFGVDYYPEHWDKSEWSEHVRLMKEGGFNTVRMAEFAWSRLEPKENVFDFTWLDEITDLLAENGIKIILGTPTAAPPKWLTNQYDIFLRDKYGRVRGYGSRRECCANNPHYLERSRIITEKLAAHYGKNPNIIAWQIDNEFGCHNSTRCYCSHCRSAFAEWLRQRYQKISVLNQSYGTVFWSQEYENFEDVILPSYTSCDADCGDSPTHNPGLALDFYRFSSDSWIAYEKMQIAIIRKYSDSPITHNMMGHFSDIDYEKLAEPLDLVSWDNYMDNQWNRNSFETAAMAHELMRGAKDQNFWVMEQQAGPCGWDQFGGTPRPGQLRLWTWQAIAHGCEGLLYFRFKSAPFGMEQYWLGVVDHDGIPRRRFYELKQTGEELKRLESLLVNAKQVSDVLLVKSYENVWSHKIKKHVPDFDYRDMLLDYYKANQRLGTNPVCGGEKLICNRYRVIYMPAYAIVSDRLKTTLSQYVKNGGTLVLTFRSGIKDENNNMITQTLPGLLRDLAGITVCEFDSSPIAVRLSDGFGVTRIWRDIMEPDGAEVLVRYEGEYYASSPAITVNSYGSGHVWYIGCDLENFALKKLVQIISDRAGAAYIPHPGGTEAIKRKTDHAEYLMLLNHTASKTDMEIRGQSLISGKNFDGMLDAYGVEILRV